MMDDGSQNMFLWKHMDNYPKFIPVTPSYLEHCVLPLLPWSSEDYEAVHIGGLKWNKEILFYEILNVINFVSQNNIRPLSCEVIYPKFW